MRELIVAKAREWLDTPYHHQARIKGVGVDCIGLVIGVCRELGLIDFDFTDYDRTPDSTVMMQVIRRHCTPTIDPEPGDLVVFKIKRNPQHVALLTTHTDIIHAYQSIGKVVEHPLDDWWTKKAIATFTLPGCN